MISCIVVVPVALVVLVTHAVLASQPPNVTQVLVLAAARRSLSVSAAIRAETKPHLSPAPDAATAIPLSSTIQKFHPLCARVHIAVFSLSVSTASMLQALNFLGHCPIVIQQALQMMANLDSVGADALVVSSLHLFLIGFLQEREILLYLQDCHHLS